MGSTSARPYRRTRGKEDPMIKRILVGTDTSASADLAVTAAAELARANEAELLVLYVQPEERGPPSLPRERGGPLRAAA